jgi:O-antigen/teichoic acid export membrane protein
MTSQASRIRWNSLFSFLSQFIRLLTNFFLFVGIARFYGPEAFGQFATAHTLSTIFLLFADFGFDMLLSTEIAHQRGRASDLAQKYFSLKVLFALTATIAMFVVPYFRSFTPQTKLLVQVFSFYVLFSALNNFFFALFKGFEQFQHEMKISFWTNLALLILLIALGLAHAPLAIIAFFFVGTRIIGLVFGARIAFRLARFDVFRIDLTGWKEAWRHVSIFGLHYIFGNLFFMLDTLLLAFWKGDHGVGIYQAVFKLAVLVLLVPDIAINTLMPVLSRFHGEDEERWNSLGRLLSKTLFLLGLPISMILFVYAEQIIAVVYGRGAFFESVPILRIFALIVLVRFSVETFALMLTTSRRQLVRMWIVIVGTGINVGMNLYFIPKFGPYGAALVSLATNLLAGLGYIVSMPNAFVQWMVNARNLILLVVTILISLVIWNVRTLPLWYTGPAAVIIYGLVFYFIGYTKEEWKMILSREKYISIA